VSEAQGNFAKQETNHAITSLLPHVTLLSKLAPETSSRRKSKRDNHNPNILASFHTGFSILENCRNGKNVYIYIYILYIWGRKKKKYIYIYIYTKKTDHTRTKIINVEWCQRKLLRKCSHFEVKSDDLKQLTQASAPQAPLEKEIPAKSSYD